MGRNSSTSARTMAVTRAERTPCPITSQINKPGLGFRERQHVEKIPAHLSGGMIAMAKVEQAGFLGRAGGKVGILLGQDGLLDVARHLEVLLENLVLLAQLGLAAGQFGIEAWRSRSSACLRTVTSRTRLKSSRLPSSVSMKELDSSTSAVRAGAEGDAAFELRVDRPLGKALLILLHHLCQVLAVGINDGIRTAHQLLRPAGRRSGKRPD